MEFFSNKIVSKITTKPDPKTSKELSRLSDIKEKVRENSEEIELKKDLPKDDEKEVKIEIKPPVVEIGKAKECANVCPKQVVVLKSPKYARQTPEKIKMPISDDELSSQAKVTTAKLDAMESEFLAKHLVDNKAKNDNLLNQDKELEKKAKDTKEVCPEKVDDKASETKDSSSESPVKSDDNFADVSNASSPNSNEKVDEKTVNNNDETDISSEKSEAKSSEKEIIEENKETDKKFETFKELEHTPKDSSESKQKEDSKKPETKIDYKSNLEQKVEAKPSSRPAYSQAAAKPKLVTSKPEVKTPVRSTTPTIRNKTIVEIPNIVPKIRQFPKRSQASKCSYPFNLTTGRTSLFDTNSSITAKVAPKKPLIKNIQMAAGDSKVTQNKVDPKKRPPRPTTLKINEKGDKKEKATPTLEKIKDCDEYSSSDTIVTQIDMSRIESSESLKTLVPEELQIIQDVATSIEVLNIDSNKSDNEGWLTVKSRRLSRESKKQSKSHWANRFHQPSATTSLPTLNMIESPKQETNPIIKSQTDRAKSEQPEKFDKPVKVVKVTAKPKSEKVKNPAMIRQKSDVTGLKTRSARSKVPKKSEKVKDQMRSDGDLTKNRLHSSLESLTTGLARSQESTEEAFDFDKWKIEFKSTFKYLEEDDQISNHNEILKSADPSEMSEIAEMTSQIEENEKKISWALDFQSEMDQRKLCEEEDLLNRQIMELQQVSDIDLDTETDDTEVSNCFVIFLTVVKHERGVIFLICIV